MDHQVKTFYLGTYQVITIHAAAFQNMEQHGGNGGLSVAPRDDYPFFILTLIVNKFRKGINRDFQFFGAEQFRIVGRACPKSPR